METQNKIPVILDGDPGHDDAIAWVIAASARDRVEIKAITTVAGNQTIDKVTTNALKIATLLNINAPVAKGRELPLTNELITAGNFHGETGLDGPVLPESNRELSKLSAVSLMAKVLKETSIPVNIIATGALTNVATLLLLHPDLKDKINHIYIMGGGFNKGNWTSAAEFNIYQDPIAANIVFTAQVPLTVCGLDVTENAIITPSDLQKIEQINNPISNIVAGWLQFFFKHHLQLGYNGAPLHDPCAIMVMLYPQIFDIVPVYAQVETSGQYCKGAIVGDFYHLTDNKPNVNAVMDVNREQFIELIIQALHKFDNWKGNK